MNLIINLNKPGNISSHQALTKVKRLLAVKKAGHAGTLDPLATGVLIICLNEATKIARFLSDLDKAYIARLKLGERTDTYDSTGRIIEEKDYRLVKETDIGRTLEKFMGSVQQIPPMFSAVKIGGKPLYKLARKGIEIERAARAVHISRIDLMSVQLPYLDIRVSCSKGTYIRTLCDEIGKALGVGAHMVSLQRTRVGNFGIEDSVSVEDLGDKKGLFYSMDDVLSHLGEVILDEDSFRKAQHGMTINLSNPDSPMFQKQSNTECNQPCQIQYVRLKSPEKILFGIGSVEDGEIKIERLLNVSSEESIRGEL
jgi:tRNA pseudouridine55 synthase